MKFTLLDNGISGGYEFGSRRNHIAWRVWNFEIDMLRSKCSIKCYTATGYKAAIFP
jgi:hypothetical protein